MPETIPLTAEERSELFQGLVGLPGPQFQRLIFTVNPPSGIVPPESAAQAERVTALLAWAKSPAGPGLLAIYKHLSDITKHPLGNFEALLLYEVLQHSLEACNAQGERERFDVAIKFTLDHCNPNGGDRSWRQQLIDLHTDRPQGPSGETDSKLVRFAVMLAWRKDTPEQVCPQLAAWVTRQHGNFQELLTRLTHEMQQKQVSASTVCDHLMVAVERVETSDHDLRVSIWAILEQDASDQESSDAVASSPLRELALEETLTESELPKFIYDRCRDKFGKKRIPTIHCFVPRDLFCCDLDMSPFGRLKERLGSIYPFVIRMNLQVHPIGQWYYDDWQEKWAEIGKALDRKTGDFFDDVDCQALPGDNDDALIDLVERLVAQNAAVLRNCTSFEELFELLVDEKDSALPVAVWSRDPALEDQLSNLQDCLVRTLPNRVQQERKRAKRARGQNVIGRHLCLVWEDPNVVPPNMQFDPEAC
jgi:hypothetical protein